MRLLNGAALTAALLLVAAASDAQSLGDAAAKEKARRKTVPKSGRVITDEDLRTGGGTVSGGSQDAATPGPSPSPGAEGDKAAKKEEKKEKTEEELKAEAQADWRKRLDAANQEASTARERVNQIQLALNDTSGGVFTPRRATLQTQFDEAQQKAAAAEQKLAALSEEGRRNGWR
jgi:hypothetical protein